MKESDIQNGEVVMMMINSLTMEECSSVEICNDNPDFNGMPDCCVTVTWMDGEQDFRADTILGCLVLAQQARGIRPIIEVSEADKKPGRVLEVVYTWPGNREEVRYRRMAGTAEAEQLKAEVKQLRREAERSDFISPYSWREVDGTCL